jgi:ubiquinol-cytochrome c reductase iron-sulfur subunit
MAVNDANQTTSLAEPASPEETRRDFLYIATGAWAAIGAALASWPFIDSMNPTADVLAISSIEIDLSQIERGQRITVNWRGNPVFIDHRTDAQIAKARNDDDANLIDPAHDDERVQQAEWLIVLGVCTHLGCVPLGQRDGDQLGDWDGWFCPCHGSHYDTSGRIRKGPAPKNLEVPPYEFLPNGLVRIG